MKYIFNYLIPVYISLLQGKLWHNGSYSAVMVYNGGVPPNATSQDIYVVLSERLISQTPNKCAGQFTVTLLVDIVAKSSNFGYKDTDNIANQILGIINTFQNPDCTPDFQIVSTSVTSYNQSGLRLTDNVFRTLLRFEHNVLQLT